MLFDFTKDDLRRVSLDSSINELKQLSKDGLIFGGSSLSQYLEIGRQADDGKMTQFVSLCRGQLRK